MMANNYTQLSEGISGITPEERAWIEAQQMAAEGGSLRLPMAGGTEGVPGIDDIDGGECGSDRSEMVSAATSPEYPAGDSYDDTPLVLELDFSRLEDAFGDGSYLRGWVSIGGTNHHLELLPVRDDESGVQVPHADWSHTHD